MEINKLALRAFYENHKEQYYADRQSGDTNRWDEAYKWDILPQLNDLLSKFDSVNSENIGEIIEILQKHQANFAHWIDMDNLGILTEKPNGWQVINAIWRATPNIVADEINSANMMTDLLLMGSKFSPSTYAYILAARNCNKFALYREKVMRPLAEINSVKTPTKQGEKYQLLNDSALYVGELMQADNAVDGLGQQALNGQDFFWVMIIMRQVLDN